MLVVKRQMMPFTAASLPRRISQHQTLLAVVSRRRVSSSGSARAWTGKSKEEHVVHRKDELDVQSEASQSGMRLKEEGKEGSQAISQKDEGSHAKKAKQDYPEAPEPILGMNDERGSV